MYLRTYNFKQFSFGNETSLGGNLEEETLELSVGNLAVTGLVHHGETLLEHLFVEGLSFTTISFLVVGPFSVKGHSEGVALSLFEETGVVLVNSGEDFLDDSGELFSGDGHFKICF